VVPSNIAVAKNRRGKGGPNPVDIHVGTRLRLRRTLAGMSQETLARAVSLTFQQIQKYESGSNRIGASRLFQFAQILGVSVDFFYDNMPEAIQSEVFSVAKGQRPPLEEDPYARRETLELVRAYYKISEPTVRRKLLDFTKTLSRVIESA